MSEFSNSTAPEISLSSTVTGSTTPNIFDIINGKPQSHTRRSSTSSVNSSDIEPSTEIYKFVLTGGPCAGKTTAMTHLSEYFSQFGFRVFIVPEAATTLWRTGITFDDVSTDEAKYLFQKMVLAFQMNIEDGIQNLAKSQGFKAIILCDRGTMDGSAYMSKELWNKLLLDLNFDVVDLRDNRYDAVLHLITAARGAEEFYSSATNETRIEGLEFARQLDEQTQQVWNGHAHHVLVDNSTSFEGKMKRIEKIAASIVGLPIEITKPVNGKDNDNEDSGENLLSNETNEYEILKYPEFPENIHLEMAEITRIFLNHQPSMITTGKEKRILHDYVEARKMGNLTTYSQTVKYIMRNEKESEKKGIETLESDGKGGEIQENMSEESKMEIVQSRRKISKREFLSRSTENKDPAREIQNEKRIFFIWNHQSYTLVEQSNGKLSICKQNDGPSQFPIFCELGDKIVH